MKSRKRAGGRIQRVAKERPPLSDFGKLVLKKRLEVELSAEEAVEEVILLGRLRKEPLSDEDIAVLRYAYRLRRLDVDPARLLRDEWEAEKRFSMFSEDSSDFARVPEFVHDGDRDHDIHGFFDPLNSPSLRAIFHAYRSGVEANPRNYTKVGREFLKGLLEALRHPFGGGNIGLSDREKMIRAEEERRLNGVGQELVESFGGDRSQAANEFLKLEDGAPSEEARRACDAVRRWQEMKKSQSSRRGSRRSVEGSRLRGRNAGQEAATRSAVGRYAPWLKARTHS